MNGRLVFPGASLFSLAKTRGGLAVRLFKAFIFFVLICLFATASQGADQEPLSPSGRLGSRAAGLGGAGVALPGTAESLFLNPAGLYSIGWPDISTGLGLEKQADRPQLYFAGALPLGPVVFGLGADSFSPLNTRMNAYHFSLAFPFSSDGKMIMGLTGKFLQEDSSLFSGNASGGGMDIGLFYPLWDTDPSMALKLGLAILDAQTVITDNRDQYRLPSVFRMGLTWNMTADRLITVGFDSQQSQNSLFESFNTLRAGLEQRLLVAENINTSFRLGYLKRLDQNGLATLGLGLEYQDWRLDYAVQLPQVVSQAFHQFSLSWGFRRKTAAQTLASRPVEKNETKAAAAPTPEASLFSALELAARKDEKVLFEREEKKPVPTATPEPAKSASPAEEEDYTYHLPVPKGPADHENVNLAAPEMPASFTSSISQFAPRNNNLRISKQDLRLHVVVNPFSPNHDGYQDKTMFVGSLNSDKYRFVRWVLDLVRDSRLVNSFSGGGQLPRNLEWDGSDRKGKILADGTYQAVLRIFDENGMELASDNQPVKIQTKSEPINLKAPESGLLTGGPEDRPLEFGLPEMRGSRDWQFIIVSPSGKRVYEKNGGDQVPQSFKWNPRVKSRPAAAGRYRAVVSFRDEIGLKAKAEAEFVIKYASFNALLNAEPALFQPVAKGGKGVTFQPGIEGEVKIKSWTLDILPDDKDTPVKTLTGEGTPPAALAWDGANEKGEPVPSGGVFHGTLTALSVLGTEAEAESAKVQCDIGAYAGEKALAINLVRVTFRIGASELTEEARKSLASAADTLGQYKTNFQLQITGHCDSQEIAKEKEMELSRARAKAVTDFMVQHNIPQASIQDIGHGSTQPLSKDTSDEARAKNRRVEILLYAQ
jgi:outer membrane protein OmpA-like peptidoglycan-associated protein